MFRLNATHYTPPVREDAILSLYEDGHWSKPYFDCGGADIWMMTYTVPFFGYNHQTRTYHFKSVAFCFLPTSVVAGLSSPPPPPLRATSKISRKNGVALA